MNRFPLTWSAFCLSFVMGLNTLALAQPRCETTDLFIGGQDNVNTYRIPSLICTKNGTLLAFAEARKENSVDGSPTDLVLKRSLRNTGDWQPRHHGPNPGGRSRLWNMTWLPMQRVLISKTTEAYMNPCPIIDTSDGSIILVVNLYPNYSAINGQTRVLVLRSADDGATWSQPVDITESVGEKNVGPGIGIQLASGRLVAPLYDGAIYSDDHGKTWKPSQVAPGPDDECQIIQLANGSLMRNTRGAPQRTINLSTDGGQTWNDPYVDEHLIDSARWGGCQASIVRYTLRSQGYAKDRILYSAPADPRIRATMTVRLSDDEAKSWTVSKIVDDQMGAYSCLTVLPDGSIGLVYEAGQKFPDIGESYARIRFMRFNLQWLTDGDQTLETPSRITTTQPPVQEIDVAPPKQAPKAPATD